MASVINGLKNGRNVVIKEFNVDSGVTVSNAGNVYRLIMWNYYDRVEINFRGYYKMHTISMENYFIKLHLRKCNTKHLLLFWSNDYFDGLHKSVSLWLF